MPGHQVKSGYAPDVDYFFVGCLPVTVMKNWRVNHIHVVQPMCLKTYCCRRAVVLKMYNSHVKTSSHNLNDLPQCTHLTRINILEISFYRLRRTSTVHEHVDPFFVGCSTHSSLQKLFPLKALFCTSIYAYLHLLVHCK